MTQQQINRTAIYCRLSRDDGDGESMSIANQRDMLTRYAKEKGFFIQEVYADDGYSGTNFDRPDFKRMMSDIEEGKIDIVLVKDQSRLGREHLQTGYYIEMFFPDNDVRFIAVNDNVDTQNQSGNNDFIGIRNVMNEFYAKDTSRKIRSARKTLAEQGKFTAPFAPYGYKKDPLDKHHLIIDKNTAPIIKRIFEMAKEGKAPFQIAEILTTERILIPRAYIAETYGIYKTGYDTKYPYDWLGSTVASILRNKNYIGTLVNHRRSSKSFKNKKIICLPEDEWIEVANTHEPIIDMETWSIVQKMVVVKKRPNKKGVSQIFAGLLKCYDCGHSLSFNVGNEKYNGSFVCNLAKNKGNKHCTWHYIGYRALYEIVLTNIKQHILLLSKDRTVFETMLTEKLNTQNKKQLASLYKEQGKLQVRLEELKKITQKLYEDNALGKLTDEQYNNLSSSFENERVQVKAKLDEISETLSKEKKNLENAERFTALIEKYMDLKELDKTILNELIERIEIHEAEKINGKRVQQVDIYYRFVGNIN